MLYINVTHFYVCHNLFISYSWLPKSVFIFNRMLRNCISLLRSYIAFKTISQSCRNQPIRSLSNLDHDTLLYFAKRPPIGVNKGQQQLEILHVSSMWLYAVHKVLYDSVFHILTQLSVFQENVTHSLRFQELKRKIAQNFFLKKEKEASKDTMRRHATCRRNTKLERADNNSTNCVPVSLPSVIFRNMYTTYSN